jgi:four helix bundle protein
MTFNEKYKDNALLIKTFNFALNIIDYTNELQDQKKFVIANQLLKNGTSIGANSKESQNAESKADFIHKLKIAIKEADETEY